MKYEGVNMVQDMANYIKKLTEENEKLKEENKKLKEENGKWSAECLSILMEKGYWELNVNYWKDKYYKELEGKSTMLTVDIKKLIEEEDNVL